MDLKDFSYVIAIAKYQNITKAANSLYITQPTLTHFLQNLEKQMGQKLFKKLGNRFVLTYAGERYVAKAREILALKKELVEKAVSREGCKYPWMDLFKIYFSFQLHFVHLHISHVTVKREIMQAQFALFCIFSFLRTIILRYISCSCGSLCLNRCKQII